MIPQDEVDEFNKLRADYKPNRATRRRKPLKPRFTIIDYINVPSIGLTKATNKIKKLRTKNAKRSKNSNRTATRARKANQKSNPQVS